jgi:hypothetical protein
MNAMECAVKSNLPASHLDAGSFQQLERHCRDCTHAQTIARNPAGFKRKAGISSGQP